METSNTSTAPASPTTSELMSAPALLAVMHHIVAHDLGAPISITSPTRDRAYIQLFVEAASIPGWLAAGFDLDEAEHRALPATVAGRRWESVDLYGRLDPHGIRIRLTYVEPTATLQVVPA